MRTITFVLTLSIVAPLITQRSFLVRITHTYTLGGDGS